MNRYAAVALVVLGLMIAGLAWFAQIWITGYGCAWANQRNCPVDWFGPDAREWFWPFLVAGLLLAAWGASHLWRR